MLRIFLPGEYNTTIMKKAQVSFVCQECGYDSPAYLGKCPECGEWNTLKEFKISAVAKSGSARQSSIPQQSTTPKKLSEIKSTEKERVKTGFLEMDGVLGGGIVNGSVILLAGDPGVGKSTLLLQTALSIASGQLPHAARDAQQTKSKGQEESPSLSERRLHPKSNRNDNLGSAFNSLAGGKLSSSSPAPATRSDDDSKVLYISAEESAEQVKLRASRISQDTTDNFLLLSLADTDAIVEVIQTTKPKLVIVDSIQTIESQNTGGFSGSVGQIRYAAAQLVRLAKSQNIPIIMVGHVTKEGMVAGPMLLSHMVDVVLFLEGEKNTGTRLLRSYKNRFGNVDEIGIFLMQGEGMKELKDTDELFVSKHEKNQSGSVLTVTLEGSRAFLVEIQALVVTSKLPMPRRVAIGIDPRRVELLLAVLQKHCNLPLATMDVFLNVAGGLRLSDPAADLAICMALFSSLQNVSLGTTVAIAEVGLLGELRSASFIEKRTKEAKKLGFNTVFSKDTHKTLKNVIQSVSK